MEFEFKPQEMFDQVYAFLCKQGPSMVAYDGAAPMPPSRCAYLTDDGKKCAAAFFMNDEMREIGNVRDIQLMDVIDESALARIEMPPIFKHIAKSPRGAEREEKRETLFLRALQTAHDNAALNSTNHRQFVRMYHEEMTTVAARYGLISPPQPTQ